MKKITSLCFVPLMLGVSVLANANTTYTYNGPNLQGKSDHLSVSFTTATPLLPSKSYVSLASAEVIHGYLAVINPTGIVPGLNLPLKVFQVHTDSAAHIDAWNILGEDFSSTGDATVWQAVDAQAYSMNTLAFIPGSDIPGAVGLVLGPYNYEQASISDFYSSCAIAPASVSCTLAGNGQAYASIYGGIINPANTDGSWWQITQDTSMPPVTMNIIGSFPDGEASVAYNTTLSVVNGTAPYSWVVSGLPNGLTFANGNISGTPTVAGTYNVSITLTDSTKTIASHAYTVVIKPRSACANKNAVITSISSNSFVVNGGLLIDDYVWHTSTSTHTTFTGGTTGFKKGEIVDYSGALDVATGCHAIGITVKPAVPSSGNYTALDQGRKRITGFGDHYLMIGSKKIIWDSKTAYALDVAKIKAGLFANWKGLRDESTNIVLASKLLITKS